MRTLKKLAPTRYRYRPSLLTEPESVVRVSRLYCIVCIFLSHNNIEYTRSRTGSGVRANHSSWHETDRLLDGTSCEQFESVQHILIYYFVRIQNLVHNVRIVCEHICIRNWKLCIRVAGHSSM